MILTTNDSRVLKGPCAIIAWYRRGRTYFEGYASADAYPDAMDFIAYLRSNGRIVKVYADIADYRAACNAMLDKHSA